METRISSQKLPTQSARQVGTIAPAFQPALARPRTPSVANKALGSGFSLGALSIFPAETAPGPADLRVSRPGDASEVAARRVAAQVLSDSGGPRDASAQSLTGSGRAATPPAAVPGGGSPLPKALRADMEQRFQTDLGQVRIHDGKEAASAARALRANAYTVGNHIVFGESQYAPTSGAGRARLAHELTHVLQQRGSGSHAIMREAAADDATPPLLTTEEALAELRNAERMATSSPPNLAAAQAILSQVERWLTALRFGKNFDRQLMGRGASFATADILVQNAIGSVQVLKRLLRLGPISTAKWNFEIGQFIVAQPFLRLLNQEGNVESAALVTSIEKAGHAGLSPAVIMAAPLLVGAGLESGLATSLSVAVLSHPVRAMLIAEFLAALGLQAVVSPEEFEKNLSSPSGWASLLWNVMLLRYSIRSATPPGAGTTAFTRPNPTAALSKDRVRLNVLLGPDGVARAQQLFDEATLNRAAQYAGQSNASKRFVHQNGVAGVQALLAAEGELELAHQNMPGRVVGLLPAAPPQDERLLAPLLPPNGKADTRIAFGVLMTRLRAQTGDYVDKARLFRNLIPRMKEVQRDWDAMEQFTADNSILYQGAQGIFLIFRNNNRMYYANQNKSKPEDFALVFRFQKTGPLIIQGIWHIDYDAGLANKVLVDVTDPK